MSAVDSRPGLPASRGCLVVGLAAAVLLAGGAILWPSAVAMGWLVGFAFWSSLPIGAIVLALIHETTGGRWGLAAAPTLRLFCLCALLSPLFFIVLAFSVTLIYPWAREGSSIAPDVARLMLNTRLYAVYGLVALLGWAAIALLLAAGRLGLLGASLSLVFHGIAISVVPAGMVAFGRSSLHRFGVRRRDGRAADPLPAGRNRSAFTRARHRGCQRRHCGAAVGERARRFLSRPHDLHREVVRRPARRRGLVLWRERMDWPSRCCSARLCSEPPCPSSPARGSASARAQEQ